MTWQNWISLAALGISCGLLAVALVAAAAARRSAAAAQAVAERTDVDWRVRFDPGGWWELVNTGRDPAYTVVIRVDGDLVAEVDRADARMPAARLPTRAAFTVDVTWHPRPSHGGEQKHWAETHRF